MHVIVSSEEFVRALRIPLGNDGVKQPEPG